MKHSFYDDYGRNVFGSILYVIYILVVLLSFITFKKWSMLERSKQHLKEVLKKQRVIRFRA